MKVCAVTIKLCLAEARYDLLGNVYMEQVRKPPLVTYFAEIRYRIRYHRLLFCILSRACDFTLMKIKLSMTYWTSDQLLHALVSGGVYTVLWK